MEIEKASKEELAAAIRAGKRELLPQLWNRVERFVARQASTGREKQVLRRGGV